MDIPRITRLVIACLLVSACGAPADRSGTGEADDADSFPVAIRGGWVLSEGGGPEGAVRGVMGERVTLTVEEDSLGGSVGCNGFGGAVEVDGQTVTLTELGGTAMACADPLMEMEQAYTAALQAIDTWELAGEQLVLSGPGTRLTYDRREEVDAVALYGTTWVLDTIVDVDTASTPVGDPATLELTEDGRLTGSTGCRTLTGEFTLSSDTLLLTTFGADGDCPADLARQDGLVIEILGDGVVPTVEGDRLTMTDGPKQLVYRAG